MRPDHLASISPTAQFGLTFATGAAAGLAVFAGTSLLSPQAAGRLLDLRHNGLDGFDAFALAWLFGQAAVLLHHVLPGVARD
ncbi:hypothetical protein [Mesorhizobium sp.]|jgi:hypothetical protein|uniref:hypothetical protein n=1 Tax=Mesorhizobium sp. TaxID=1871066 RepID=UPI003564028E